MIYNKNIFLITLLFLITKSLSAQLFDSLQIVDSLPITNVELQFADIDNDSQIDLFVRGINTNNRFNSFILTRQPTIDSMPSVIFDLMETNIDSLQSGEFHFSDIDNDNLLDLIISGELNGAPNTQLYFGTDSFLFDEPINIAAINANMIEIADLSGNGLKEIVLSGLNPAGELVFQILENQSGIFNPINPGNFQGLTNGSIRAFDFNNNSKRDILYHGMDEQNTPKTFLYLNTGELNFESKPTGIPGLTNGNFVIGEINNDTIADILIHGENEFGENLTLLFEQDTTEFMELPSILPSIQNGQLLLADINADGLNDIVANGNNSTGEFANYIYINEGSNVFSNILDTTEANNFRQLFGHLNCDGNLDRVQSSDSLGMTTVQFFLNNTTQENKGPIRPGFHAAINTPDKVIIVWDEMFDDHTSTASLTSDLYIRDVQFDSLTSSSNFLLSGYERNSVIHGNQGYTRFAEFEDLDQQTVFEYGIQSVDNSFKANSAGCSDGGGTLSLIATGRFIVCDEMETSIDTIRACEGALVTLPSEGITGYYSSLSGFIGIGENIEYTVTANDVVYFGAMGVVNCSKQGRFHFEILEEDDPLNILEDQLVCPEEVINISYTEPFDSLFWTIQSTGEEFIIPNIEYSWTEDDIVFLEVYLGGCRLNDTMQIEIREINVETDPNTYIIQLGESVQLNATGATFYNWKPENLITINGIPNPVVTPNITTTFTVEGIDNFNCSDTASVLVIVNSQNWAPTLFTPNGDGRNDHFRIYGTNLPDKLEFLIFNRSGQIVFQTDNSAGINGIGWNGRKNGKEQPTGVYFWKVNGTLANGEPFLVNGKKSGAIHLVR